MPKLLLFVLFVLGVVLWFKHQGRRDASPRVERPVEDMVRCAVCRVNLPRSEAILSQGKIYCCDEHRRRGS